MADKMARPTAMTIKRTIWEKEAVEKNADSTQAGVELHGSEAQRRRQTENRRTEGDDINQVAPETVQPMLQEGIKTGTQGYGKLIAESEIGQGQADDTVNRPGMDPPMEQGVQHGFLCLDQR